MKILKVPRSAKFQFSGGGGILGQSKVKVPSPVQFLIFGGRGVNWEPKSENRVNQDFLTKFSTTPASYCITDGLSHTTYVETKKM